jgi:hypothetical protein
VTSVLAVIASKLLLRTIEIHFSEQVAQGNQQAEVPEQRETALSLPFLLHSCLDGNWVGGIFYLLSLVAVLIALLRTSVTFGFKSYTLLANHADLDGDLAIEVVIAVFIVSASITAYLPYQSLQIVHIICILLNILYAVSKVTSAEYVKERQTPTAGSVFPHFVSFLAIELIIPSVVAVSKVSPRRHWVLITWAVVIVAACYSVFSYLLYSGAQIYMEIPLSVKAWITLPCLFANIHIPMGALVDVVIAWRYGLNVKVAEQHYPQQVQAVRMLLPFALYAFCFFFSFYGFPLAKSIEHWVLGSLVTVSLVLCAIAYCYKATQDLFEVRDEEVGQRWWVYAVSAGGVVYTATALYFFYNNERFNWYTSFGIDIYIIGVFVLWQLLGQFFN